MLKQNEERSDRPTGTCQSIDWYSEGDSRVVEVGDVRVEVRLIDRKGRRSRIIIIAPSGAAFRSEAAAPN